MNKKALAKCSEDQFLAYVRESFVSCTTVEETCTDEEVRADYREMGPVAAFEMYQLWDDTEEGHLSAAIAQGWITGTDETDDGQPANTQGVDIGPALPMEGETLSDYNERAWNGRSPIFPATCEECEKWYIVRGSMAVDAIWFTGNHNPDNYRLWGRCDECWSQEVD